MTKAAEHFEVIDKRGRQAEEPNIAALITDLPRTYGDPSPLNEYLLIKANAKQTIYRGTQFVIPDSCQESPNMGVVVAVGSKILPETMKAGDLVTFSRYRAEDIEVDGDKYILVSIHDIKLRQEVAFAVARNAN
jgi:co-chaperonin GroES (HSP10)